MRNKYHGIGKKNETPCEVFTPRKGGGTPTLDSLIQVDVEQKPINAAL